MKLEYRILYRNGHEDCVYVEATEDNAKPLEEFSEAIQEGFKKDVSGILTLGDESTHGSCIRLSDVVRVSIRVVEEDD